jgi:hypothetical protein
MFWTVDVQTVDVLGQKVDVLVVDVLEVGFLEVDKMGRPERKYSKLKIM